MVYGYVSESGRAGDAYRLLAHAFSELYGKRLPRIEKTERGKPFFPDLPELFFSVSHTKTHVMAALGGAECGCDIETLRPVRDRLPRRVCAAEELSQFDFFELWVLKESYLKLLGYQPAEFRNIRFSRCAAGILTPEKDVNAAVYQVGGGRAAILCRREVPPPALFYVPPEKLS